MESNRNVHANEINALSDMRVGKACHYNIAPVQYHRDQEDCIKIENSYWHLG